LPATRQQLSKWLIIWLTIWLSVCNGPQVGCTNVTDDRQTDDRRTDDDI